AGQGRPGGTQGVGPCWRDPGTAGPRDDHHHHPAGPSRQRRPWGRLEEVQMVTPSDCGTPTRAPCPDATSLVPPGPWTALRIPFGMLMGVDDFETDQAYHRGKMRLHNAWLHREGVVWGVDVRLDHECGEVRVSPGLALDQSGHELHLDAEACL